MSTLLKHHGSPNPGSSPNPNTNPKSSSVREEYFRHFRTKSYIDMRRKAQGCLEFKTTKTVNGDDGGEEDEEEEKNPPLFLAFAQLSDYLIEPKQELVFSVLHKVPILHGIFLDYFKSSLEACKTCVFLLESIHCTRANDRIIRRVLIRWRNNNRDGLTLTAGAGTLSDLASFARLENPFSPSSLDQFQRTHDLCGRMMTKIMRREKLVGFCRKAFGLFGGHYSSQKMKKKWSWPLDATARGAFILCRDLDTMSLMVVRLVEEIEHRRDVIGKLLQKIRKEEVVDEGRLREVVKEMENNETWFMEQVEELEEHVYLFLLTINRCRMLVVRKLLTPQP